MGSDITNAAQVRIARAGLGRTFQHVKLRPAMTVLDNVLLGTYVRTRAGFLSGILRLDRAEEGKAVAEAMAQLARVGLAEKADDFAGNLPLGNQRVLEVARALAADPALIILDEPAAGLRAHEKAALAELLRQLRAEGVSILLVEHDMDFVDGPRRPHRGDGVRREADGRRAGRGAGEPAGAGSLPRRRGMSAPLLAVEGLSVAYGKVEAVRDISLTLERGEIVTIIGPNGAGKTTLLAAVMGLLPSRGRVLFEGVDIAGEEVVARVERGISIVPEQRELFGEMSVSDNLMLGGYRHRRDKTHQKAALAEVYGRFPRLAERAQQKAMTLSGGERQMLALGRALMARPRVLLLDEPSLGLAPIIVREIFHIIASLKETGVSVLLVEQNARAALETASRGYVLETGSITIAGAATDLMHDPRVARTYLGGSA